MPMSFAASALPCPAIIPSASSMRIGLINPNSLMLAAICLILLGSVRARIPCPRLQLVGSLYVTLNAAMARPLQDRQPTITFNAVTAAVQRDRLVLDSATTDVILKMKRFPCYFLTVAQLRRNRPLLFFSRNFARNPYGIGV